MSMFNRALESSRNTRDAGVTLIELLVVITILGVLATIVAFSVAGLSDNAEDVAKATDAATILTAEEAYFAANGHYAPDTAALASAGFLSTASTLNNKILISADGKRVLGAGNFPTSQPLASAFTTGPRLLGASNTTTPFTFLASDFISTHAPVQFFFGSSTSLATTANAPSNTDLLFASADEANVLSVIKSGDAVAGGLGGTCTVDGTHTCPGIGATKVQYTTGRLVVFSCKSGGATLLASPTCAAPSGGYLTGTIPTTPAQIVARLQASQSPAAPAVPTSCAEKLSIADPGGTLPLPAGTPAPAPYGYAAYEALTSSGTGGGGLTTQQFKDLHNAGCIVYGSNVTVAQTNVVNGTAHMALLPKSQVVSPFGNDTDNWTTVESALHLPIKQWAVVLNHGTSADQQLAKDFLAYLLSSQGRAVLAAYGYDPVA